MNIALTYVFGSHTGAKTVPQVGGHEGVGIIVKMGPGTQGSAVKVGDRVGIKWLAAICGSCRTYHTLTRACCM
jgi:propanol-preferring alcohol dehydrogenase